MDESEARLRAGIRVGINGSKSLGRAISLAMLVISLAEICLRGVERVWKARLRKGTEIARALHSICATKVVVLSL